MWNSLYCLFAHCLFASIDTFPEIISNASLQGHKHIILSEMSAPDLAWPDIKTYYVKEPELLSYLGIAPKASVLVDVQHNLHATNTFRAYDIPTSFQWNGSKTWKKWPPKNLKHPDAINTKLGLQYTDQLISEDIQLTIVFKNETKAYRLVKALDAVRKKIPDIKYRCFNLLYASTDLYVGQLPAIVISSAAIKKRYTFFRDHPTRKNIIGYIEANANAYQHWLKVYKSEL